MASRTALVMANQGDPFLGGLARLAFKGIRGLVRKVRGKVSVAIPGFRTGLKRVVGSRAGRLAAVGAGAVATGAAFAGGEALFDAAGNPVGTRRRRRARGITATELRGFKKVTNLLGRVGMVPRKTGTRRHSVAHP